VNLDPATPYVVERGDRIAQLVVLAVQAADLQVVEELPPAQRNAGGFGSTGR
jgi:dUTP pyrophosphatase